MKKLAKKGGAGKAEGLGAGIAALAADCAVHMMLEAQLAGPQASFALELLNRQLAEGMANLKGLPPQPGDIPSALCAALKAASQICRDAMTPSLGPAKGPAVGPQTQALLQQMPKTQAWLGQNTSAGLVKQELMPKVAELLLRMSILRASFGDSA